MRRFKAQIAGKSHFVAKICNGEAVQFALKMRVYEQIRGSLAKYCPDRRVVSHHIAEPDLTGGGGQPPRRGRLAIRVVIRMRTLERLA